jgi:hypothetical protein
MLDILVMPISRLFFHFLLYFELNFLIFGTEVLHLIQINHQPDATVFQLIILTFVYRGDSRAVFVVGLAGRPDHEHSTTITTIRR